MDIINQREQKQLFKLQLEIWLQQKFGKCEQNQLLVIGFMFLV